MRATTIILGTALCAQPLVAHGAPFVLQRTWTGEALLDQFGIAVSGVGDLNADGWADLIVGANVNDQLIQSGGRSYFFSGGPGFPQSWQSAADGADSRGYFGQAIDGGGDFDGDGFPDWVVGAPGPGDDGLRPGSAFLFLGGPGADQIPDLRIDGTVAGGQFGFAVSLRGDLDGDGRADLVIGAPRALDGEVHVVYGYDLIGPPGNPAIVILPPSAQDSRFGFAIASLDDQDADGDDELVVAAPRSSRTAAWAGAVFMFRGGNGMGGSADLVLPGLEAGEEFGRALCSGTDIDGDGDGDLLVGAPFFNDVDSIDVGRVAIFRAGTALDSIADGAAIGEGAGDRFGTSIAAGFDWDGDGMPDWAAGAPNHSSVAVNGGAFYVYTGLAVAPGIPIQAERGAVAGAHIGTSICSTGPMTPGSLSRGGLATGGYNATNNGRVLLFSFEETVTAGPPDRQVARLGAPYPNPFNPRTSILLETRDRASWIVRIIDVRGRHVGTVFEGALPAGSHPLIVDASGLSSGVYWFAARSSRGDRLVVRGVLVR